MAGRPIFNLPGPSLPFVMPNIQGKTYRPGRQPNAPGESQQDVGFPYFSPVPWPNSVPVLRVLSSNPGIPRGRALGINNNQDAVLPSNYLFIAGFAGKSRG